MDELRASFEKVASEHRELRETIQVIRASAQTPKPDIAGYSWAESLGQQLFKLHGKLSFHFREEKEGGVLAELVGRFPRAHRTIMALEDEHGELLGEVREIVAATMSLVENKPAQEPDLAGRTVTLLDKLAQHEERETELMERLYCEDLGTGD